MEIHTTPDTILHHGVMTVPLEVHITRSLTLEKGERTALFAPSGYGKSTLSLLLTGYLQRAHWGYSPQRQVNDIYGS